MREFHRFLSLGAVEGARAGVLGSFSTQALTRKDQIWTKGDSTIVVDFFYGSDRNNFWNWYIKYFDRNIYVLSREEITRSLQRNKIAITDLIDSCERVGSSSLDSDLRNIRWNTTQILQLGNSVKLWTCTSKWVHEMAIRRIFRPEGYVVDFITSLKLQKTLFENQLPNTVDSLKIVSVLKREDDTVTLLSLPTPGGGTFRKLDAFGYEKGGTMSNVEFLNTYNSIVFRHLSEFIQ